LLQVKFSFSKTTPCKKELVLLLALLLYSHRSFSCIDLSILHYLKAISLQAKDLVFILR
jgi:hypothetical protein